MNEDSGPLQAPVYHWTTVPHMHHKPYQVAVATDPTLLRRKWDHKGTIWGVTARDVVLTCGLGVGEFIGERSTSHCGSVYEFTGNLVRVDFGS